VHDITIFRGGEKEVEEANWDRKAVYFKLKDGKRMIGDSGYNGEPNKLTVWKDEQRKSSAEASQHERRDQIVKEKRG
jgi:hypothetical protein